MRFAITIISPLGYRHSAAFCEVAETVMYGLRSLGHEATINTAVDVLTYPPDTRAIVFGAHMLPDGASIPDNAILYNLEQIEASALVTPSYFQRLETHEVWDYNTGNVRALAARDIRARLVPIGYVEELSRIEHVKNKDIDVLFCGCINERRRVVLDGLAGAGINAIGLFGAYGKTRDELISRSKIVLNLHYFPTALFEIVRVSYLLANGCCVVSEGPAEVDFSGGVAFAPYDDIVSRCVELLADDATREELASAGLEVMRARPESAFLWPALRQF